jgi:hypothetical protein
MKTKKDKLPLGARIAPAVALLLFGDSALAQTDQSPEIDDDAVSVPEPSTLALLATGGAVAGIARAIRKRREK